MSTDSAPPAAAPAGPPGKKKGNWAVWLFLVIGLLLIALVWVHRASQKYSVRARIGNGIVATAPLRDAMVQARERGVSDMSCDGNRCNVADKPPAIEGTVASVASDRAGVITIEYRDASLPADRRRLVLIPSIDGKDVDLSSAAVAGKQVGWRCSRRAPTTVPEEFLPSGCH